MNEQSLVSIVMCTYNGAKYLDEQLYSLVNQTYKNLQITIADDASTDDTVAVIKGWMKNEPRISLYQNQTNVGYNRNFEYAITLAKGEFIALCDQDDIWYLNKIERLITLFDDPKVILAHARSVEMINGQLHYPQGKQLPPFSGNDPKKLFYDNQIGGHKIMFRSTLAGKISPVPPNMFYDWWIGVLAACNGYIEGLDEYLVKYRIHGQNAHINVREEIKAKHIDHITAWKCFLSIDEMQEPDKAFLRELISKFGRHRAKKRWFDVQLFYFLLKNHHIVFANRRRLVNDFFKLKFIYYYAITKF